MFVMGWGGDNDVEREEYLHIQVSCEASAGVEGYTCQRPGALPFFFFPPFYPAGRMGASQPSNPTYPSPPRSRPVLSSHAWPSLGIHSGCFLFIASTPLSLSLLYLSHQAPSNPSLLSLMKHLYFVKL